MTKGAMNANAKPYVPTSPVDGLSAETDTNNSSSLSQSPHQKGKDGFVILNEEDLPRKKGLEDYISDLPLTEEELAELESVEQRNELLAELDVMESQEEMHRLLMDKIENLRNLKMKKGHAHSSHEKAKNALGQSHITRTKIQGHHNSKPIACLQQPQ